IIIRRGINSRGVSEPLVQQVGSDRVAVQLPGVRDPDLAIKTFGDTGLLEFIDTGDTPLHEGDLVTTTGLITGSINLTGTPTLVGTSVPGIATTPAPTSIGTPGATVTSSSSITVAGAVTPVPITCPAAIRTSDPIS